MVARSLAVCVALLSATVANALNFSVTVPIGVAGHAGYDPTYYQPIIGVYGPSYTYEKVGNQLTSATSYTANFTNAQINPTTLYAIVFQDRWQPTHWVTDLNDKNWGLVQDSDTNDYSYCTYNLTAVYLTGAQIADSATTGGVFLPTSHITVHNGASIVMNITVRGLIDTDQHPDIPPWGGFTVDQEIWLDEDDYDFPNVSTSATELVATWQKTVDLNDFYTWGFSEKTQRIGPVGGQYEWLRWNGAIGDSMQGWELLWTEDWELYTTVYLTL